MERRIAEAGSDGPERNEADYNLGAVVADFVTLNSGIASPIATQLFSRLRQRPLD